MREREDRRFAWSAALLVSAVAGGLIVVWVAMDPPGSDLRTVAGLLGVSALLSLSAYALLLRALPRLPLTGPHGRVAAASLFAGGLALANVILTAAFMFISSHDLTLLAALLAFALLVSTTLAVSVAGTITEPIRALARAVEASHDEELPRPVPIAAASGDEIAQLAAAYNAMAERLTAAAEQRSRAEAGRRELVAAISHDLRTPIANGRLLIEAITDAVVDSETARRYLQQAHVELLYLDRLIDDLFELSKLEAGGLRLERQAVDLAALLAEAVETVRPQAEQAGVVLRASLAPDLPLVSLDELCMGRALRNVLTNAVRYTPPGGVVLAAAQQRGATVEVTVVDEGPGVAREDAERIFEPFFRSDAARHRDGAGAGLGLAIARGIVEAHGGEITLESHAASGATFRTLLPVG